MSTLPTRMDLAPTKTGPAFYEGLQASGFSGHQAHAPAEDSFRRSVHQQTEAWLQTVHVADRDKLRGRFGNEVVPRDRRYLFNTVSPQEGFFVAGYLDIPNENMLKIKTQKFHWGGSVHRDIQSRVEEFCDTVVQEGGALTLLGHMDFREEDTRGPIFARLPVRALHACLKPLAQSSPQALNFLSCSSKSYSRDLARLFHEEDGLSIPMRSAVEDGFEVSQWPQRGQVNKPITMLYAGPEIGIYKKCFDPKIHFAVITAFVTEGPEALTQGLASSPFKHSKSSSRMT